MLISCYKALSCGFLGSTAQGGVEQKLTQFCVESRAFVLLPQQTEYHTNAPTILNKAKGYPQITHHNQQKKQATGNTAIVGAGWSIHSLSECKLLVLV
eukprot:2717177-Amphidinium_carterae.1